MSKLAEYRALEKSLQEQLAQLDALKNDEALKHEMAFETKGGNHKILKQWKEQYGAEAVEGWLQH